MSKIKIMETNKSLLEKANLVFEKILTMQSEADGQIRDIRSFEKKILDIQKKRQIEETLLSEKIAMEKILDTGKQSEGIATIKKDAASEQITEQTEKTVSKKSEEVAADNKPEKEALKSVEIPPEAVAKVAETKQPEIPKSADKPEKAVAEESPKQDKQFDREGAPRQERPAYDRVGAPRQDRPTYDREGAPRQDRPYNRDGGQGQQRQPYGTAGQGQQQRPPYNNNAPQGQRPPYNNNAPQGQRPPYNNNAPQGQRPPYNNNAP